MSPALPSTPPSGSVNVKSSASSFVTNAPSLFTIALIQSCSIFRICCSSPVRLAAACTEITGSERPIQSATKNIFIFIDLESFRKCEIKSTCYPRGAEMKRKDDGGSLKTLSTSVDAGSPRDESVRLADVSPAKRDAADTAASTGAPTHLTFASVLTQAFA